MKTGILKRMMRLEKREQPKDMGVEFWDLNDDGTYTHIDGITLSAEDFEIWKQRRSTTVFLIDNIP